MATAFSILKLAIIFRDPGERGYRILSKTEAGSFHKIPDKELVGSEGKSPESLHDVAMIRHVLSSANICHIGQFAQQSANQLETNIVICSLFLNSPDLRGIH